MKKEYLFGPNFGPYYMMGKVYRYDGHQVEHPAEYMDSVINNTLGYDQERARKVAKAILQKIKEELGIKKAKQVLIIKEPLLLTETDAFDDLDYEGGSGSCEGECWECGISDCSNSIFD